jgi:hypothetical protein
MKLNKKRALAQASAVSIKSAVIEPGTVIRVMDVLEGKIQGTDNPNDTLFCETENGLLRIPTREYMKFKVSNGNLYSSEDAADEIEIADSFKVVSSEPRKDRDGDLVYPSYAYNAFEAQIETGEFDWNELKASKLKDDFTGEPVQNYTIELL